MTHRLAREIEWNARSEAEEFFRASRETGIRAFRNSLADGSPFTISWNRSADRIGAIACKIIQIEERWISKVSLVILDTLAKRIGEDL